MLPARSLLCISWQLVNIVLCHTECEHYPLCVCLCVSVCVSVSSTPEQEQLMVMWLSWMIKEEEYFER